MSRHIGIVAKGIVLDSVIDNMIKELSVCTFNFGDTRSEVMWQDYQFYRPCIINCVELYNFISLKFYDKESILYTWTEFRDQYDDRAIHGFIDYCILRFTNDPIMKSIAEIEQRFIYNKLNERIQKLNRSIQ